MSTPGKTPSGPRGGVTAALVIGLLGLGLRLGVWLAAGAPSLKAWEYEEIAQNLLAGRGFGIDLGGMWYRTFGSPPFSYLCAGLYLVFGHHQAVVMLTQWLISASATVGIYMIGVRLFATAVGLTAAALTALHPGIVYYDTHNLHPLGFDAALVIWGLVGLFAVGARPAAGLAAGVGLLHGLALFERTTFLGLPLATLAWLGVTGRARRWRVAAAYVVAVALVVAPWLVRSLRLYGAPVMTSTAAEILWRGNNPYSDGGSFARDHVGVPVFAVAPAEFQERVLAADETARQRIFTAAAREFILTQPAAAAQLMLRKLLGFWWFMPQSGALYPHAYLVLYKAYYVVTGVLALIGLAAFLSGATSTGRWMGLTVLGFMASVSLAHSVFYVEMRHRWGVEPLLLIFTAAGACTLLERFRRPRTG